MKQKIFFASLFLCGAFAFVSCTNVNIAKGLFPYETQQDRDNKLVYFKTIKIDGLDVFYREAGDPKKPTILLLHGFPSSSHMYRDLINDLSADYHYQILNR